MVFDGSKGGIGVKLIFSSRSYTEFQSSGLQRSNSQVLKHLVSVFDGFFTEVALFHAKLFLQITFKFLLEVF